jgi:hypothetical protein
MTLTKMHWLLGRKAKLCTSNKIHTFKAILKPIWTYGIKLWGAASTLNIEILERSQCKVLRTILVASWYVPNAVIRRDLLTPAVKEEIRHWSSQCSARLSVHPNNLTTGSCEDVGSMICLPDSGFNCLFVVYSLRFSL